MSGGGIEAERAVLASVLINNATLDTIVEIIGPDSQAFREPIHQVIYDAMLEMAFTGVCIDAVTLNLFLDRPGGLSEDLEQYLAGLIMELPTSAHASHYAVSVHQDHLARQLWQLTEVVRSGIKEKERDVAEVLEEAERGLYSLSVKRTTSPVSSAPELRAMVDAYLQLSEDGKDRGVPCGLPEIDKVTMGWQKGDMIIVGARPSVGKTQLALNWAFYAAQQGVPVLFASLEMSRMQVGQRLMAIAGQLELTAIRDGRISHGNKTRYDRATNIVNKLPLWCDDSSGLTLWELRSKTRRWRSDHDSGMLVVDYLQLLKLGGKQRQQQQRYVEVGEISRTLKGLARELDMPVVVCCQLNREADNIGDHFRRLACLREAGDIEQDADLVFIVSQVNGDALESYKKQYGDKTDPDDVMAITLAKHRNGKIGQYFVWNDKATQRILPLSREKGSPAVATTAKLPYKDDEGEAPF